MSIYRDEQHAAIRAVAVDAISTCQPAQWQQQYRSGFVEELTRRADDVEHLPAFDRLTQDCMTRALVKRTVARGAFYALVAKYSADEKERAAAIETLADLIQVKAPRRFVVVTIWSWASVAVRRGMIEQMVRAGDLSRRALMYKRKAILEQLRAFEDGALSELSVVLKERGLTPSGV